MKETILKYLKNWWGLILGCIGYLIGSFQPIEIIRTYIDSGFKSSQLAIEEKKLKLLEQREDLEKEKNCIVINREEQETLPTLAFELTPSKKDLVLKVKKVNSRVSIQAARTIWPIAGGMLIWGSEDMLLKGLPTSLNSSLILKWLEEKIELGPALMFTLPVVIEFDYLVGGKIRYHQALYDIKYILSRKSNQSKEFVLKLWGAVYRGSAFDLLHVKGRTEAVTALSNEWNRLRDAIAMQRPKTHNR